jgi:hypothetical protein
MICVNQNSEANAVENMGAPRRALVGFASIGVVMILGPCAMGNVNALGSLRLPIPDSYAPRSCPACPPLNGSATFSFKIG